MKIALLLVLALAGCKKKQEEAPAPPANPAIPEAEMKRARDACADYVARVCACTTPAAVEECKLAKLLPDALELAREITVSPEVERQTILQSNATIRKTVKSCIEKAAALTGC